MNSLVRSFRVVLVLGIVTGVLYPAFNLFLARTIFPQSANLEILKKSDVVVGAKWVGQKFQSEKYFWGRPSASDYNSYPSSASNLGPTAAGLKAEIQNRTRVIHDAHPTKSAEDIPLDLLTSSASGLDPDISLEAAIFQVDRIVRSRKLNSEQEWKLNQILSDLTQKPIFGLMGTTRVNVLELNLALDSLTEKK